MRILAIGLTLLFPLIQAQPPTSAPSANPCPDNNPRIVPCQNFQFASLSPDEIAKLSLNNIEQQIAVEGHWNGIKPDQYRISLNFTNATHYEGALAIDVTVNIATNKIFLHRSSKLNVDFPSMFLQEKECRKDNQTIPKENCIVSIGLLPNHDIMIIELASQLLAETKYTMGIQKFRADIGFFNPINKQSASGGVFWSDAANDASIRTGVPAAMSTVFRMREARTAFPCFDHPRLKARYTLCMEHPENLIPASNTPVRASIGDNKGLQRKRTCFETTPPISTYVFTFALLHGYESEQRLVDTELVVEILAPQGQAILYRWLYDAVIEPMRFMGGSTRFRYPLKRIAFLLIDSFPYAGVENFGLVTLNSKLVKGPLPEIPGRVLVNHEIVHQWFGGVVTITDWKEICVQEGLTAYYEWSMSSSTLKPVLAPGQNLTVGDRARRALASFGDDYQPFLRDFQNTREINDHCYGVPPLFFKSLADAFGDAAFYRLFAEIMAAFQFDNADIDAWDEALAKATNRQDLHNYIRSWFTLPGYPRLFISRVGENQIELAQAFSSGVRPLFIRILESSNSNGTPDPVLVIDKQVVNLPLNDLSSAWFLVNPDDDGSPLRKIYTLEHYRNFLNCNASKPGECKVHAHANTSERRKIAGKDFCLALLEDRFPWGVDDQTIFDSKAWADFFNAYIQKGELESECECCLRDKDQLKTAGRACVKIWNSKCRTLRINRQLGRAFKLDEE